MSDIQKVIDWHLQKSLKTVNVKKSLMHSKYAGHIEDLRGIFIEIEMELATSVHRLPEITKLVNKALKRDGADE